MSKLMPRAGRLLPDLLGEVRLDQHRARGGQRRAAEPRPVHRFRHRHAELQHVQAVLQDVLEQADARRAGSHHRPVAPEDDVRGDVGRDPVAGAGHDPQEVGARGADAHALGEEAVAPRVGHARVEDGRDVAGRVHHRHVVAARGRGWFAGARDRVPHLEQVEPHPRVVLREDRLERQRVARGIVLPAALRIDQVADPDHLEQALGGFDRRAESLQIEELQHVQHLDDVSAAVVRGRGTGDLEIPVRPPRRLLPARLPAFEVLRGQDAARGLDHLADLLREVPPVEVVVPLFGEPLQGVGGLLLVERRAGPGDRVPVEEDLAARGGAADLLGLDEDFAPEERVHLEAAPGVGDRVRHQLLPGQRSVAVVGRLEAAPPAGHRHPAPRGEVVRAVAGKRRHRRVHVAVDVGRLAGRLVEIQLGEAAGDGGHVRLDHGLGDRGGERRVAGVAAFFQGVDGGPGRERVRSDRHSAGALGGGLLAEVGEFDEALALYGVGAGGRGHRARCGKRGAGEAGRGRFNERSPGCADLGMRGPSRGSANLPSPAVCLFQFRAPL